MTFPSRDLPKHLYFITATICGWKPLFEDESHAQIVLNSLNWLRDRGRMSLYAYVLMPTHLHAIVQPLDRTIGELLQNFGSFTAHEILKELRVQGREDLLQFFREYRRKPHHQHSIWQDIQAKNVYTPDFLNQKLEYIHNNPVAGDWILVEDRSDYRYSSACFYDGGVIPIVPVDDVRELF